MQFSGHIRLPMAGRINRGMKTLCFICMKPITDEYFIGGFIEGQPNVMLHESCFDGIEDEPLLPAPSRIDTIE